MTAVNTSAPILIIANSARMLVQMAVADGFRVLVIDTYADVDTRLLALVCLKVDSLDWCDLEPALEQLSLLQPFTTVVYGSGFEQHQASLAKLEQRWQIIGNRYEVFTRLQDKAAFFTQLAKLGIPYPETQFGLPDKSDDWLYKPLHTQGGLGIRFASPQAQYAEAGYWQRYISGFPMSVTFLACAGQVSILGFNHSWTQAIAGQAFLFAGIASHAAIAQGVEMAITRSLNKLATVYNLQGLGSLDFILADQHYYVLEINARPPASAQLYGNGLFSGHFEASLGLCPEELAVSSLPAAYQIIYAPGEIRIPLRMVWPTWTYDIPENGAIISKGHPICSIIASENSAEQVSHQLLERHQFIKKTLITGS